MIKLLCVNAKEIHVGKKKYIGKGLVLGEIYTTRGEIYKDIDGLDNYFIEEVKGERLACRFTKYHESQDEKEATESVEKLIRELNRD